MAGGTVWKKGADTLHNGTVMGALLGAAIVWGSYVHDWVIETVPTEWLILGDISIPVYLIGAGALLGYLIDRH